jgi:sugar lactone lactonase YvrE
MKIIVTLFFAAVLQILFVDDPTNKITFNAAKLYPEGIAFDRKNNIAYVSSVKTGTIGSVDEQGKYTEVYADKELKSTFGMKIDEKKNLLWVCAGDPNFSEYKEPSTFRKMARVVGIDLKTHKKVRDIDLARLVEGDHFPNDLTLDDKGNLYVTDSYSPVIYKIDQSGTATVWAKSDRFKSSSIGLNGIAYHPEGFLLVAHNTDGCILKVDLKNPSKVQKVDIPTFFPGADGLWVDEKRNLILVQNKGVNKVFKLTSTDGWNSATIAGHSPSSELLQNPTTCGKFKDDIYVLNAKINELSDSSVRPSNEFSFQKVVFK